jgi:hypothetical protein
VEEKYELSLYLLMYGCMFNLTKLVCTSTLLLKESNNFDFEISSLIIFSISAIFYLIILFKYTNSPSSLGCFYSSFDS